MFHLDPASDLGSESVCAVGSSAGLGCACSRAESKEAGLGPRVAGLSIVTAPSRVRLVIRAGVYERRAASAREPASDWPARFPVVGWAFVSRRRAQKAGLPTSSSREHDKGVADFRKS